MSNEPLPPPPASPKPQLPPANKPTLPPAPKLSLAAGSKAGFKPETSSDPFATETARPQTVAAPAGSAPTAASLPRPPSIGAPAGAPSATKAPIASVHAAPAHAALIPLEEEPPKWAGALSAVAAIVAVAATVLTFLDLKPAL